MGHQVRIADVFQLPDTLDFALLHEPDTTSDWGVVLTQRNPARPGQLVEYVASLARTGSDSRPHHLQMDFDSRLTFQQIIGGAIGRLQPSSLELEPVRLDRPSVFDPRENRSLRFRLPDNPALAGTFLDARLHLRDPDNDPSNNESRERRRIVRDAQVTRKIVRSNTLVAADTVYESDVLDYIIYFQNLGRGPVRSLVVDDVLSPHLDVTTLQTVAASHPYQLIWGDLAPHADGQGRRLSWRFPNIQLPDSVADPLESVGFVRFRIRPRSGIACGTAIHNEALIHFGDQPPLRTPAVRTVVNPLPAAVVFALRDTLFVGETNRLNLVNQRHVSRAGTWDFDSDATPTGSMGAGPFDVSWSSPGLKHVRVPLANAYCAAEAETQIQVNWRCPSADLQFIAPDTVYVDVPFEVQAAGRSVPGLRMTLGSHPSLVGPTILWPNQPAMLQVHQAGTLVLRITTVENDSCRYDLEHSLYAVNCPLPTQPPLASTAPCVGVEEIIVHSSAWGTKYLFFPSLEREYRFRPDDELERKAEAEGEVLRNLELELIDTATNCRHYVVYPIRLRSCPYKLPEAFTPNGDGINDRWGANPELWQTVRLRVFDRNGRLVFSSNQVQEHWDGTHAGRAVLEGAFHYVAEGQLQNGQQVRLSGRVTLLR
jgi:gliding motility-associated-like protein